MGLGSVCTRSRCGLLHWVPVGSVALGPGGSVALGPGGSVPGVPNDPTGGSDGVSSGHSSL